MKWVRIRTSLTKLTTLPTGTDPSTRTSIISIALFGGVQSFNLASASGTVSVSGGSYAGPYPANTASYVPLTWLLTGTMTANVNLQLPASVGGQWAVYKQFTSGAYTVTVRAPPAVGATVTIPQGGVQQIYCDQTNVNYSSLPYGSNLTIPGTLSMSSSFLRNKFINGDLSIDQYNSGNSATIPQAAAISTL